MSYCSVSVISKKKDLEINKKLMYEKIPNVYKEIEKPALPLFITNWIVGIGIAEYPMGKPRRVLSFIYSTIVLLLYCLTAIYAYPHLRNLNFETMKTIIKILFFSNCFLTVSTTVLGWYRSKVIHQVLYHIAIADHLLENIGIIKNYAKIFKSQLGKVIGFFLFLMIIITLNLLVIINFAKSGRIFIGFIMNYPIIIMFIVDATFINLIEKFRIMDQNNYSKVGEGSDNRMNYLPTQLDCGVSCLSNPEFDGIILVSGKPPGEQEPEILKTVLNNASKLDKALFDVGGVLPIDLPAKRLIYSPTGKINPEYGDVRSFAEAAKKGVKRALKAGVQRPLLVLLPDSRFENVELATLLGALEGLYVPLEVREINSSKQFKARKLGVWSPTDTRKLKKVVKLAEALESGRFVARDIGAADPERMAPPRVQEYVTRLFSRPSNVAVKVISDVDTLEREYPLFAAVNRGASVVQRHHGRVIFLTYEPADRSKIQETIMLVGKGVTYDSGGADIKTGGNMKGMSRDKCGAAAVVGFMRTVSLLEPSNLKVVAAIAVVRNSVGSNCYVSDEVITARSGARVRVNNTDAEGRMAMADLLCHVKELAQEAVNPRIFTIATLTGHAALCAGTGYTIAIDNAVARSKANAQRLQACGETMGDMIEVSVLRREDWAHHKGKCEGDDVLQTGEKRERGHQGPCAFLMLASGLDKHDKSSEKPLHYCHLDIAASAGDMPENCTGVPILALSKCFLAEHFTGCLSETEVDAPEVKKIISTEPNNGTPKGYHKYY